MTDGITTSEKCARPIFFFTDLKCILRADYPVTLSIQRIETEEKDDMVLNPLLKKKKRKKKVQELMLEWCDTDTGVKQKFDLMPLETGFVRTGHGVVQTLETLCGSQ